MSNEAIWEGTREQLYAALYQLPAALSGGNDPWGIAPSFQQRIANAMLEQALLNFVSKSKGEGGADGVPWDKLKLSTIKRRKKRNPRGQWPAETSILWEYGKLKDALEPGKEDFPSGRNEQVIETERGKIKVTISEKPWHHKGSQGSRPGHFPARPFWPDKMPGSWSESLLQAGNVGMVKALRLVIQHGPVP